jgi:hypothetical protein
VRDEGQEVNPLFLGPLLEVGKTLLDRFVPDPEKKREAEAQFLAMAMQGELKQIIAQLEINAKEATHPSMWVAGWRPAVGWVGALGLFYATIGQPLLAWASVAKGWPVPPDLNVDLLWVTLSGMLGIGGLRTYEKAKGVATK